MFASKMVWLGFFLTSLATTGNWTHFSSVAPHLSVLNPGCFTNWATAAAASLRYRGPGKNEQLMLWSPSIFRLAHHETEINSVPFVDVSPVLLIFYRSCKKLVGKKLVLIGTNRCSKTLSDLLDLDKIFWPNHFLLRYFLLSPCDLKKSFEQLVH